MPKTKHIQESKQKIYYELPKKDPLYMGIFIREKDCFIAMLNMQDGGRMDIMRTEATTASILKEVKRHAKQKDIKFVAAGVMNKNSNISSNELDELFSNLWLQEDIVPFELEVRGFFEKSIAKKLAKEARNKFAKDNIAAIHLGKNRRVLSSHLVRPADYKKTISRDDYDKLINLTYKLKEKGGRVAFFSSTPRGGGVALMRHSLIRLFSRLGADVRWYVMDNSNPDIFQITKKKFHNILQGVAPGNEMLSQKDKETFRKWSQKNARSFSDIFKWATIIVIDDPQPSGMIPYIKKVNPEAKLIYRSHIQIYTSLLEAPQQKNTWEFIWENVRLADVFVSHPIKEFVPPSVPPEKVVYMPATTDELDGLNKPLSEKQLEYYMHLFNAHLRETGQTPLDKDRKYIAQIARFDPSKGIPDVVVAYRTFREKLEAEGVPPQDAPQLIIAGHGSIDDPEGSPILEETMHKLNMDVNKKYAGDIKVARLPHIDQLLNAILTKSHVILQLSHKEGFEIKVSEALAKGKPVIAYKTGGIPLQIEDGVNGYLVPVGNTAEVAGHLYELFVREDKYRQMSLNAEEKVRREYFTVGNAIRWLQLFT